MRRPDRRPLGPNARSPRRSGARLTPRTERSLDEIKRRTKVIGRFPGETSGLTLVWAVLDLYMTHATNDSSANASSD